MMTLARSILLLLSCLTTTGLLQAQQNPATTSVTPKQHYKPTVSFAGSYVDCKKCFGHAVNPSADPRCKYGCGRNMTYPPTRIPCELCRVSKDPRCREKCWGIDTRTWKRDRFTASPMFKLVPDITVDRVPLVAHDNSKKKDGSSSSTYIEHYTCVNCGKTQGLGNSLWIVIGVVALVAAVSAYIVGRKCSKSNLPLSQQQPELRWQGGEVKS